jgi:hypothetical protein
MCPVLITVELLEERRETLSHMAWVKRGTNSHLESLLDALSDKAALFLSSLKNNYGLDSPECKNTMAEYAHISEEFLSAFEADPDTQEQLEKKLFTAADFLFTARDRAQLT